MKLLERYEEIETNRLSERASQLFDLLKDCRDIEALQEIGRREGEMLRGRYKNPNSRGTVISRAGYYKRFRGLELVQGENAVPVMKADGSTALKHAFTHECGLSASEWHDRNETDRVSRRLSDGHELQPAAILATAAALLGSNDWRDVSIGLMIATGRRPHEIVARAKFDLIDGDEWQVMFAGQGKKRGEKPVFPIATLLPASACRSALLWLRRNTDLKAIRRDARSEYPGDITAQNAAIDSRTNKRLNRFVHEKLADLIPKRAGDKSENCKSLRAAYLAMACERDCNGLMGQKMLHAARLAGHITESETLSDSDLSHIATTLGYADYFCSEVPHYTPPKPMSSKQVRASAEAHEQIGEWGKLWGMNTPEVIDRIIELARQQLANPTATEEPTTAEDTEMNQATEARFQDLESKLESMMALLLEKQSEAPKVDPPAPVTVAPKPAAKTTADKNAEAMANLESVPYTELCERKGYGVSFARCQRVYEALQSFNEQYPEPEKKIAINKSLLRAVDGCNNSTAAAWLEYFSGDIADYHESHGIENPAFHNRKHHSGRDFVAEVHELIK